MNLGNGGKTTPGLIFHNSQNENSIALKHLKNESWGPAQNATTQNYASMEKPTAAQNADMNISDKYEILSEMWIKKH